MTISYNAKGDLLFIELVYYAKISGKSGHFLASFNRFMTQPVVYAGAAVVYWLNHSPCKSGLAGSITGFTSMFDETIGCGPVSI